MDIEILFEDQDTLVVNKPFGVVVNRAESISGVTMQDWVEDYAKNHHSSWSFEGKLFVQRSGVCHRLDKETSGCLMFAKNPEALNYYLGLFKDRKIEKEYEALVHGRVEPKSGDVILPLKRSLFDREKWSVHYEGKRAVTEWRVERYYAYADTPHWKNCLSLMAIRLKTGRTHQIRVHMSFLGWPIFADEKYLNKDLAKKDRGYLNHHFLHAKHLEFVSFAGEKISVVAPLPKDCMELLSKLMLE